MLQDNKTAADWANTPEIRALIENYSKCMNDVKCVQKSQKRAISRR
jgi:hypothetical protein